MEKKESPSSAGRAFDWAALRRRLESSVQAAERGQALSRDRAAEILRQRAKSLAQEPPREAASGERLEVVTFLLAYETYAIESRLVREVYPLRELTPLPGAPPFFLGIASVRGQILPVIDLKRFFELPEKGLTDLNKLVILRQDGAELGVLADQMRGLEAISAAAMEPSLPTLTGIRADYLKGVTKDRTIVLDAEKIVSDRRILEATGGGE